MCAVKSQLRVNWVCHPLRSRPNRSTARAVVILAILAVRRPFEARRAAPLDLDLIYPQPVSSSWPLDGRSRQRGGGQPGVCRARCAGVGPDQLAGAPLPRLTGRAAGLHAGCSREQNLMARRRMIPRDRVPTTNCDHTPVCQRCPWKSSCCGGACVRTITHRAACRFDSGGFVTGQSCVASLRSQRAL